MKMLVLYLLVQMNISNIETTLYDILTFYVSNYSCMAAEQVL